MQTNWLGNSFTYVLGTLALALLLRGTSSAQQTLAMIQPETIGFGASAAAMPAAPAAMFVSMPTLPEAPSHHKFWDVENRALFAMTAAGSAADFAVTYSNLQKGGQELNPVTRIFSGSTAGLAANFVGQTGGVIGLSYFFHQTGHHKMERLTPLLNFGASAVAVGYGLAHR
jgi:hypothetical protein